MKNLTLEQLIRATELCGAGAPDLVRNVPALTRAEILSALNTLCRRLRLRLKSTPATAEGSYDKVNFAECQTAILRTDSKRKEKSRTSKERTKNQDTV